MSIKYVHTCAKCKQAWGHPCCDNRPNNSLCPLCSKIVPVDPDIRAGYWEYEDPLVDLVVRVCAEGRKSELSG